MVWLKIKSFFTKIWRTLLLIDWASLVLGILKVIKKEDQGVDPKYIVIKPRILSDHNMLRSVGVLRSVLAFVPPAAVAAPVLVLGEVGFNIWKRIALSGEYDSLFYPPIDPSILRVSITLDSELNKHYGHLTTPENWNSGSIGILEEVHNDFSFITNAELLQAKYPQIDPDYIKSKCQENKELLDVSLDQIEQEIIKVSQRPEINANLKEALEALKTVFPVMRDWALFNSEGFDEIVEILDTVI